MTKIVLAALLAFTVATSANAGFSVSPLASDQALTRVAEGCGPGMWRGPHGRCLTAGRARAAIIWDRTIAAAGRTEPPASDFAQESEAHASLFSFALPLA